MRRWPLTLLFVGMLSLQAHPWLHGDHALVPADQLCVGCHMAEHGASVDSAAALAMLPLPARFEQRPRGPSVASAAPLRWPEIRGPPGTLVS